MLNMEGDSDETMANGMAPSISSISMGSELYNWKVWWHICHPFNLIVYDFSSITGIITYYIFNGTLITH